MNEGPEQDADGFSLPEQLDETSCPEQPQETQVDEVILRQRRNVATGGRGRVRSGKIEDRERQMAER